MNLKDVKDKGYYFYNDEELCSGLLEEVTSLPLDYGDHIHYPINNGKSNQVTQSHERYYQMLDHISIPTASRLCYNLASTVNLPGWLPNEIGYQRYRDKRDYISPHKDRQSDHLLSITLTIAGSAWIKIYKESSDYSNLVQIDEYLAVPNTVMVLRAPGFGNGEQIIHEVMPPLNNIPRIILNLRMRSTLLKTPDEYRKMI